MTNNPELTSRSFEAITTLYNSPERRSDRIKNPFVVFMGPSGVGKSTLMGELITQRPDTFTYIKPYTTRALRDGEKDKIHVELDQYMAMKKQGKFAYDNHLYGVRYGTPVDVIQEAIAAKKIPLLDFPLHDVGKLQLPIDITPIGIYCFPPDIQTWMNRMNRDNRGNMGRVFAARELWRLHSESTLNPYINFAIINRENRSQEAGEEIYNYLQEIIEHR